MNAIMNKNSTDVRGMVILSNLQFYFNLYYWMHYWIHLIISFLKTLLGCTLYVALFPCNECAKLIIQAGIRQVVYMSDKHKSKPSTEASKLMFNMAGVKYQQFVPKNSKIVIDFEEIDWNISSWTKQVISKKKIFLHVPRYLSYPFYLSNSCNS